MKIGFTGRRDGMSDKQKEETLAILEPIANQITEAWHGGCIGADADFHEMCLDLGIPIVVAPGYPTYNPDDLSQKANLKGEYTELDKEPFLKRNRAIVDNVDTMIGCPPTKEPQNKGGTWYTIKYSLKKKVRTYIVEP